MPNGEIQYPVSLEVDYPERCDRLTTFFRLIVAVPILIILGMLLHGYDRSWAGSWRWFFAGAGYVFVPTVLLILFNKKYPRWWFDWNVALVKFEARVAAYLALLTHEYPSTDEEQAVHIEIAYPDVQRELLRGMPLIKWFLILPHVIVLAFLGFVAMVCIIVAWFAILFTGGYPRELFDFVVGVMRWSLRVEAYAFILTTDRYPPFRLSK